MKTVLTAGLMALSAAACTTGGAAPLPPAAGDAYLTVVGDDDVLMANGWQQAVVVRYHDGDEHALAGEIAFSLEGGGGGANLSATRAVTDGRGEATVTIRAGIRGDAAFSVEASAEFAAPASWKVAVSAGEPTGPLELAGRYQLDSELELVAGLPGAIGEVTAAFTAITDGPHDPATWVLDQAVAAIGDSTTRAAFNAARPTLDGLVNDALRSAAPDAALRLLDLGSDVGQLTRKLGLRSTLTITGAEPAWRGEHALTHVVFTVDGETSSHAFADLGLTPVTAPELAVTHANERVALAAHALPLSYGALLVAGLDEVVIPQLDDEATDVASYLLRVIPCDSIGATVANRVRVGSAALHAGACRIGVTRAATAIVNRLRGLDGSPLLLEVAGLARPEDTDADLELDLLEDGAWTGRMSYAGAPVTLGASTFRGERTTD